MRRRGGNRRASQMPLNHVITITGPGGGAERSLPGVPYTGEVGYSITPTSDLDHLTICMMFVWGRSPPREKSPPHLGPPLILIPGVLYFCLFAYKATTAVVVFTICTCLKKYLSLLYLTLDHFIGFAAVVLIPGGATY